MSILVGTLIGVAVYEVLLRPLLLRAFYCIRSWWRFGRRRAVPKDTTTTTKLDAMVRSSLTQDVIEQWANQPHVFDRFTIKPKGNK